MKDMKDMKDMKALFSDIEKNLHIDSLIGGDNDYLDDILLGIMNASDKIDGVTLKAFVDFMEKEIPKKIKKELAIESEISSILLTLKLVSYVKLEKTSNVDEASNLGKEGFRNMDECSQHDFDTQKQDVISTLCNNISRAFKLNRPILFDIIKCLKINEMLEIFYDFISDHSLISNYQEMSFGGLVDSMSFRMSVFVELNKGLDANLPIDFINPFLERVSGESSKLLEENVNRYGLLFVAIKNGMFDIFKKLVESGVFDLNFGYAPHSGMTPLMYAHKYNKTKFVKFIVEEAAPSKSSSSPRENGAKRTCAGVLVTKILGVLSSEDADVATSVDSERDCLEAANESSDGLDDGDRHTGEVKKRCVRVISAVSPTLFARAQQRDMSDSDEAVKGSPQPGQQ